MDKLGFYNPFTYQPVMQAFYLGRPMPAEVSSVAANNPGAAQHINSIWQFATWLNQYFPEMYNIITGSRPDLLDPSSVVLSGKLTPTAAAPSGSVKGLAALIEDASGNVTDTGESGITQAVTEWGKTVSDLLGKYLVYDQQKKLIELNIKRAEQGLAPIDASQFAAGVNVGLSPAAQNLAYLALGGLVIVGLLGAFRRGR